MLKAHAHRLVAHVPGAIRMALANDPAEALRRHLGRVLSIMEAR